MTQNTIIKSLGMDQYRMTKRMQVDLANQYKGLYQFAKMLCSDFKGAVKLESTFKKGWTGETIYNLRVTYGNSGSASFDLPNHYITNDHLNEFNSSIISLLQSATKTKTGADRIRRHKKNGYNNINVHGLCL